MNKPAPFWEFERTGSNEAEQLGTLIADLDRLVQILECDIATEEARTQVFDPSDRAYPMLARTLTARRDNLQVTIAALQARLLEVTTVQSHRIPTPARLKLHRAISQ